MAKKKADSKQESLAKELRGLIPKLDSEGLAFLVEQARIHIYNMQVTALNQATLSKAAAASAASPRKGAIVKKPSQPKNENMRIDGTESGSSYYLYYRNGSIMFSRDEMTHLVKMVNADESDLEIRDRLFRWFERERMDIFAVVPIADKFDERLKTLVKIIKKNFKLRD